MDFLQKRKTQLNISSVGDMFKSGALSVNSNDTLFINGPQEFDCLKNKWSRKELLGIVGDSGCGKSEMVLYVFKHILLNNKEGCCIYVSLEMTTQKLAQRWVEMTKDCPEISDRFYIISRYNEDGTSNQIDIGHIVRTLKDYKLVLGDILSFAVDHLHVIGDNHVEVLNSICIQIKELCVNLNSFGMLLAQVSKGKGQAGEVPLDADSVYSASQFKWVCSDIIQIHRPIKRLEGAAGISVMGWGYAKIREASTKDGAKVGQNKLLIYDLATRSLRKLKADEKQIFKTYYDELLALKQAEEDSKAYAYDMSSEIVGKNGQVVVISEVFSGSNSKDDL